MALNRDDRNTHTHIYSLANVNEIISLVIVAFFVRLSFLYMF
jgi:hypothetical protein